MKRLAVVILGHSHLSSVVNHLATREAETDHNSPAIEYYVFNTIKHGVDFRFSVEDGAAIVLNPRIKSLVEENIQNRDFIWLSMFGGNAHNALTLLEHPRPFDFILPENVQLPRIPKAELVPYSYIESFIHKMAELYILNTVCLRHAVMEDVLHIESPPPNGDDKYVMEHLENYFREQSSLPRIAPRILRYKLWRTHSQIIKSACEANNIKFVDAPSEACDPEGYLVPSGYSGDSTHAGPWYGGLILKQVEKMYGLPYGGWSWL
ncbi:hypothetical protein [Methylobacterium nonmethylotrophicum]|uniref:Uncharacterized protein n=1 Tax=Methylobacterium nonmethylotrophicum TaxID=1141884 RepID=A0A4Z0NW48_9HYPH|nr:hypothetical protein [Methylobacterium nonmethylotrophicum]TGE01698.1 hypothetical protein EU555_03210 [Methylobacterium nonmethylotrophicum]